MCTCDSPSISAAAATAFASALLAPVDSMAADSACSPSRTSRSFSALALSSITCRSRCPFASCSRRSASWRAAASCDLVVISIANCTDFISASRVLGSTGSTPWISTLVTTSRLFLNSSRGLGRPVSRLMPKTAAWMMLDELRWNVSNGSPATAPRTREAMALHASPTKFDTLNTLVAASTSPCGQSKNQLYASCSDSRAWSEVSTCTRSVMKSGPRDRHSDLIFPGSLGLPPDSFSTVNSSSGPSITKSGPKAMRGFLLL
mmetsp:Transcript_89341/g.149145  ORF Transcript_89341/g.149145 Transcript_89341/m.149145 type:complete len:261 (-) Transcript_89341:1471-2253(-)